MNFDLLAPAVIIAITALVVLSIDIFILRGKATKLRWITAASTSTIGCCLASAFLLTVRSEYGQRGSITPFEFTLYLAILAIAILVLWSALDTDFTEHIGEFCLLVLLATVGMMLLVVARNLLVFFIALELLSLSLYALSAFDKRSPRSAEAALKYFLFGGVSAAFLLFGFSLLYGATHTLDLDRIRLDLAGQPLSPLVLIAIVTTIVGLGFKVAAAPFHFWAPDVYDAAPAPAVNLIATSSKIASFLAIFTLLAGMLGPVAGSAAWNHVAFGWAPALAAVAILSMLWGNLAALRQTTLRRLLAYSAVAHAGYMLLAILAGSAPSLAALAFYVITYATATLGCFIVATAVEHASANQAEASGNQAQASGSDALTHFAGLHRRSPLAALCLFVSVLSLAGIPPLSGFVAKFALFSAALQAQPGLLWLVLAALAGSAISLVYYLRILKAALVHDEQAPDIHLTPITTTLLIILTAATLALGLFPNLLLGPLGAAVR